MAVAQVVVVVDPVSTGGCVAAEAKARGFEIIAAWCEEITEDMRCHVPDAAKSLRYLAHVEEKRTIQESAAAVRAAAGGRTIVACIVGAESGVTFADKLSLELGVRSNGIFAGGDRRNKSVQQKAVKAAGLRAVREALGKTWEEVSDFVEREPLPIVVKPVESCGSDGVKLCKSREEVKEHFQLLMESQRRVGAQGAAVLCQEFLKGKEYVVDHVSRDGVHKTVMVWVYDKRPTNGAAFVYYGMIPVDVKSPEAQQLIKYTQGVLDALKLDNGPTHGEVMMTADGPCLVEMNCRSHGWDGAWVPLAKMLTGGYAQPDVALDAHVDGAAFEKLPISYPSPFKAAGQNVMLVSFFSGTVRSTPGYERMRQMSSFVALQTGVGVGSKVELTVDLFTAVGVLVLANRDQAQLQADLAEVRKMERDGLFVFDEDVDPAQFEQTPDLVLPAGRRRTESLESIAMAGRLEKQDRQRSSQALFVVAGVAFCAGALAGLAAGKRLR
jgi:biotin carboxylase